MSFLKQGKTSASSIILFCIIGLIAAGAIGGAYSLSVKESEKLLLASELVNQDLLKTLNWQTFRSKLNIFEIRYPQSWRISTSTKGAGESAKETIILQPKDSQGFDYAVFASQDFEEFNDLTIEEKLAELQKIYPQYKEVENDEAQGIIYLDESKRIPALHAMMAGPGHLINLSYAKEGVEDYQAELYERYEEVFLRLLSTFKFL